MRVHCGCLSILKLPESSNFADVVGIFVSRRETTNPKPTLFVTLVVAFGLVLLCWVLVGHHSYLVHVDSFLSRSP